MRLAHGSTDVTIYVQMVDSTAGTPETGLTITNIDATYTRNRAAAVKNDLTALSTVSDAHADNQGIEVDSTNAPGLYRVDFPDAAFASGVDKVILTVTCTGCAPVYLFVELGPGPSDLTHCNGTAVTSSSGRPEVNTTHWSGTANATPDTAGYPKVTVKSGTSTGELSLSSGAVIVQSGTGTGQISLSSGTVTVGTNNDKTGYTASTVSDKTGYSLTQSFPTNFASLGINASGHISRVTLTDTCTTNTDMRGTDSAYTGTPPTVSQIATAVWQDTTAGDFTVASSIGKSLYTSGAVPGASGGLFIAGTNAATTVTTSFTTTFTGSLTGSVASVTGAVGSVTGNVGGNVTGSVGSVTGAVGSVTGNVGGNVVGSVASVSGAVGSVTATVTVGAINSAALADLFDTDSGTTYASAVAGSVVKEIADNAGGSGLTAAGIADAVWDELLSGHAISGSAGAGLSAAGSAGDPWSTSIPGSYTGTEAGYLFGLIVDLLQSDEVLVRGSSGWTGVKYKAGTSTALLTKRLLDSDGNAITSTSKYINSAVQ